MPKLEDFMDKSTSREVDILTQEIAVFKNLIKERKNDLDLVRELLSNAGAREVGATRIEISYTKDKEGHIFDVLDDGCGMNFTGSRDLPGRLDRFLGLGFSAITGEKADEFSWKGLGSKLTYQSRRVEIETRFKAHPLYEVRINEPWSSLERNLIPKPRITEHEHADTPHGTRIKVIGHPPHRQDEPFEAWEIRAFLLHRTFAGLTRPRENPPEITLSVLGETEQLKFGFPEFGNLDFSKMGLVLDPEQRTLFVNLAPKRGKAMRVQLKGFLTWDGDRFGLSKDDLNTGLILSSKGIPYFTLDLAEYGASGIPHANPGVGKTCLVLECDAVYSEMSISRSFLVDSSVSVEFKKVARELVEELERSPEYREFRQLPKVRSREKRGEKIAGAKKEIESEDQTWVVLEQEGKRAVVLMREPKNESDALGVLWKLEALGALPFTRFRTIGYVGASGGPDLFVDFQEEKASEAVRAAAFEVENNFYSYKSHKHLPSQYPKVICWDIPSSGRKTHLTQTTKKYKRTAIIGESQLHVYVMKLMDGISVRSTRELRNMGVDI